MNALKQDVFGQDMSELDCVGATRESHLPHQVSLICDFESNNLAILRLSLWMISCCKMTRVKFQVAGIPTHWKVWMCPFFSFYFLVHMMPWPPNNKNTHRFPLFLCQFCISGPFPWHDWAGLLPGFCAPAQIRPLAGTKPWQVVVVVVTLVKKSVSKSGRTVTRTKFRYSRRDWYGKCLIRYHIILSPSDLHGFRHHKWYRILSINRIKFNSKLLHMRK